MNLFSTSFRSLALVLVGWAFAASLEATTAPTLPSQPCGNDAANITGSNSNSNPPSEGDPFNPYVGNEYRNILDLKVWGGVGQFRLTFTRWANSRYVGGTQYFGNGHNWRHNYQWDIADTTAASSGAAQIEIIAPEGSDSIYTQSATTPTSWVPISSITDSLTQAANGTDFYLTRKNGLQYHIVKYFNPDGSDYYLMTDFKDTQGNDYILTYNAAHEVTQVTEPGGRFIQINYTTASLNTMAFANLATVTATPASAQYTTLTVTDSHAYRYLRWLAPDGSYCNVTQI